MMYIDHVETIPIELPGRGANFQATIDLEPIEQTEGGRIEWYLDPVVVYVEWAVLSVDVKDGPEWRKVDPDEELYSEILTAAQPAIQARADDYASDEP